MKKQEKEKLESLGYEYKPYPGDEKRKFLQKVSGAGKRRIHIHLTLNKDYWKSFIALRNYLRENKEVRDKYESIKKEAVEKGKEKENYRKYKEKFIKKLVEKALNENRKNLM